MIVKDKMVRTKLDALGVESEAGTLLSEDLLVLGVPKARQRIRQHVCLRWNPLWNPDKLVLNLFRSNKTSHFEVNFVTGAPIRKEVETDLIVCLSQYAFFFQDAPQMWQLTT